MRKQTRAQAGSALVYGLLAVVVVVVVGLAAWKIHSKSGNPGNHPTSDDNLTGQSSTPQTAQSLTAGTDDASLSKDLDNINGSLGEGNQNLQSATTATNDESQFVSVPTN